MDSTTIVGYTYQAELLCPACTLQVVSDFDMAYPAEAADWSTEQILDFIAANPRVSIDRSDETTFDSSEFPKVVFADQLACCDEHAQDHEYLCDSCDKGLI